MFGAYNVEAERLSEHHDSVRNAAKTILSARAEIF